MRNVLGMWITNTQTQFAFAMSDEGPIEESILHAARRLGYHDLREQQLHAAKKFLQGNDVFVSLPRGLVQTTFGKISVIVTLTY